MFAPPIKKVKEAAASNNPARSRGLPVPQRAGGSVVQQAEQLQRSIGNQAMLRFLSHQASTADGHSKVNLPSGDASWALKITDPPQSGSGSGSGAKSPAPAKPAAPAKPTATDCDKPVSMVAVTSGSFVDKLTLDDYYPEYKGKSIWVNAGTAGPWDDGKRVGISVQLIGSVNASCHDNQFQLTQTVHHDKSIINGAKDADDGTTHDDIKESGGDYTKPPRRQVTAVNSPSGGKLLHISMADPPSLLYAKAPDAEWDRTFVTGLVGPKGKSEVTWKASLVVKNGKVTKNTVS